MVRGATQYGKWALALTALLAHPLLSASGHAQSVSARVQPETVGSEQMAVYSIIVEGAQTDEHPSLALPPPLGMHSTFVSQNLTVVNGIQSHKFIYNWQISSPEPGEFVIPAQEVHIGGKLYKTNDVKLKVTESAQEDLPFDPILQIKLGKTRFYQGEVVPISVSLFLHRSTAIRRTGLIEMTKENLAVQRFPMMYEQSSDVVNGEAYNILTTRSTLSALKSGSLTVGPATMEIMLEFEVAGMPSFFPSPRESRKVVARSQPVNIEVLPLPEEGKPPGFTGAVGDFTLGASISPAQVNIGDPITVEHIVGGTGNFDALVAPHLTQPEGWKTYPARRYVIDGPTDPNMPPPTERRIGFTQVLVPEKPQTEVPPYELVYFSPTQNQYVTLRSEAVPITVVPVGGAGPGGSGATGSADGPTFEARVPPPEANISDILIHTPATAHWIGGPAPSLLRSPVFWALNVVPAAVLIGLCMHAWNFRRRMALASAPDAFLRTLWQDLQEPSLKETEFYRRAAQFIHAAAADQAPTEPARQILDRYEQLNFSVDSSNEDRPVSERLRAETLAALAPLLAEFRSAASDRRKAPAPAYVSALLIVAGAFLTCVNTALAAASPDDRYQEAANALRGGDYNQAQKLSESLLSDGGLSPEVFELLGHVRYRQGDEGRAVLWYERARLFTPRVPELRQNLRFLHEKVRYVAFPAPTPLQQFGLLLKPNRWILIATAGGWMLLIGIGFAIAAHNGRLRAWAVASAFAGLAIGVIAIAGAAVRPEGAGRVQNIGIITTKDTRAYTAASSTAGSVMDLPPGSQVRLLEKRGAWAYVEIPENTETIRGWIESDSMSALWPWRPDLVP